MENGFHGNEVSEEELREWGKEKYPMFLDNLLLLEACYKRENGMRFQMAREYVPKNISDIQEKDLVEVSILVAKILGESKYRGCSRCKKKRNLNNNSCTCGEAGITEYTWTRYLIGDNTGSAMAKILHPRDDGIELHEGEVMVLRVKADRKFRGELKEVMVHEVAKGDLEQIRSRQELNSACAKVRSYFEIVGEEMDESDFQGWFEQKKFSVPYSAVVDELKLEVKDGNISLRGE